MTDTTPRYAVVVPVYNNGRTLEALHARLCELFDQQLRETVEFIFVDDCSPDDSGELLERLNRLDSRVGVIRMENNVGQHQATLQGLLCCRAEQRITMDADLQTDPREILKLLSASGPGVDVVIGPYVQKRHGLVQRAGSFVLNHFLLWLFFGKPRSLEITSFKLFHKTAVEKLRPFLGREGYLAGFILREVPHGRIVNSEACIHMESAGQSSYSWGKRLRLAGVLVAQSLKLGRGAIPVSIASFVRPS